MDYDVVIVGAGFAGLALASMLPKDVSVCIIEKNSSLTGELRTTGTTSIDNDNDIFSLYGVSRGNIINEYKTISLSASKFSAKFYFPHSVWSILDIGKLKEELYRKSQSHCTILYETEGKQILNNGAHFTSLVVAKVNTDEEYKITARVFVDASGYKSTIAKSAGFRFRKSDARVFQADCVLEDSIDSNSMETIIGTDYCPKGYAYICPFNSHEARIGTWGEKSYMGSRSAEDLFWSMIKRRGIRISSHSRVVDTTTSALGFIRKNTKANLLLIGDSSGHIVPLSGEGIRPAFYAADIANALISHYLNGTSNDLSAFPKLWKKLWGHQYMFSTFARKGLNFVSDDRLNKLIEALKIENGRDEDFFLRFVRSQSTFKDMLRLVTKMI